MRYNKIENDYTSYAEQVKTSTLVSKVLAFRNCTENEIEQLFYQPTHLSENKSSILQTIVERIQLAKKNNEKVL